MSDFGRDFRANEIDVDCLAEKQFDLFLMASGYEERAVYIASKLSQTECGRRVAIGFSDRKHGGSRENNDDKFTQLGFELVAGEGRESAVIEQEIDAAVARTPDRRCRILIDYSSMTRVWYAGALRHALVRQRAGIEMYFVYSVALFSEPTQTMPNRYVGALEGFSALTSNRIPTALVIGLGYEAQRAHGLVNYIEPARTFSFLADPSSDKSFVDAALSSNASFLASVGWNTLISYPLLRQLATAELLESCCVGLTSNYRVIIAPLGPKPFTLLSLLLASKYPSIEVWRVSAGEAGNVKVREPSGDVLALRVETDA